MELEFSGEVFFWRGPAPWFYVAAPDEESAAIEAVSRQVTYGWGVIPVRATVGEITWTTSLFPKEARYVVPLKVLVRKAERVELGDMVTVRLTVDG